MKANRIAPTPSKPIRLTDEQKRRQRGKNIAVLLALLALVALLYVVTLVRIGGNA
ncbi:hypothetical protein [Skermanella stibiiresistens]|uniref:hypothetical protein n=1 Tax=Skermanella stibiiresistens TaxID=913326 RepID=UPI001B3B9DAB|nr:hypothetical protein [Skermanella stibiiresistens]